MWSCNDEYIQQIIIIPQRKHQSQFGDRWFITNKKEKIVSENWKIGNVLKFKLYGQYNLTAI